METKIINGVECVRYKKWKRCRTCYGHGMIQEIETVYGDAISKVCPKCKEHGGKYQPFWRKIPLAPKKAKGKAKKVESVKAVKAWGVSMDGEIIPSSCRNARIDSKDFNVGLGGKVIRVEIRPLVTRKKGK